MDRATFKLKSRGALRPLVLALDRAGVSPLAVSLVGLLICAVAGWVTARGSLLGGALLLLVGSAFDMLDGDLARLQGKVSPRGAFLDSNFDRLGESLLFAGLLWFYLNRLDEPRPLAALLILGTVVGSLTTSYARARAEGLGSSCPVGLLQRPERMALLIGGMLLGWRVLEIVLLVLAALTLGTTIQRIVHVSRKLPGGNP
jgi:phosphatidylglycerophosphate synthase